MTRWEIEENREAIAMNDAPWDSAGLAVVATPTIGDCYGERQAIEEMQPDIIEQPAPRKVGLGIVLLKITQGWADN